MQTSYFRAYVFEGLGELRDSLIEWSERRGISGYARSHADGHLAFQVTAVRETEAESLPPLSSELDRLLRHSTFAATSQFEVRSFEAFARKHGGGGLFQYQYCEFARVIGIADLGRLELAEVVDRQVVIATPEGRQQAVFVDSEEDLLDVYDQEELDALEAEPIDVPDDVLREARWLDDGFTVDPWWESGCELIYRYARPILPDTFACGDRPLLGPLHDLLHVEDRTHAPRWTSDAAPNVAANDSVGSCPICEGEKHRVFEQRCRACKRGWERCLTCRGKGRGVFFRCRVCEGAGRYPCTICKGRKVIRTFEKCGCVTASAG